MRSTFNKYSRVRSRTGMTGREAAEYVLRSAGIYDVRVEHVGGNLTDHYDPGPRRCASQTLPIIPSLWLPSGWLLTSADIAVQHATGYAP